MSGSASDSGQSSLARLRGRAEELALAVLLICAAAFYALFIALSSFTTHGKQYFTLIDDAMISMRYAQHLAQGAGLVWNVGESPVQGFTNPAWTLIMAGAHLLKLPVRLTSLAIMVLSGLILLGLIYVVYRTCKALAPDARYAPLLASAITAFYFPLTFWSLRGLEVGWLTLLIGLALLLVFKLEGGGSTWPPIWIGLLLMLAIATRLDATVQVVVLLVYIVTRRKISLARRLIPCIIAALALIGVLAYQRFYFGDALPNTYYQKLVGTTAIERVRVGILVFAQYASRDTVILALVAALSALLYRTLRSPQAALLAALFLAQCAYSVWVGGDYAEPEVGAANRFITQGMPSLFILFAFAVEHLLSDVAFLHHSSTAAVPAGVSVAVAAITLAIVSGQPWASWAEDGPPLLKADIRRVRAGLAIADSTSPNATIAVHAAGQIPYYSNRRTIDLLGLNDPIVAKGPLAGPFYPGHDKWNYDYSIMELKPDLIADNWIKLADYMRDKLDYRKLENGMYVRQDSTLVDVPALLQAFP
jgi:hypothetical protein